MYGCEDRGVRGEDWNGTFYHRCTSRQAYGNLPAVRALLESGEDVNKRDPELGQTALHLAAYFDKPVTLKVLIEAGADVNAQMSNGATPLTQPPKKTTR